MDTVKHFVSLLILFLMVKSGKRVNVIRQQKCINALAKKDGNDRRFWILKILPTLVAPASSHSTGMIRFPNSERHGVVEKEMRG